MSSALTPIWVSEIELAAPPTRIVADRSLPGSNDGERYQRARILIRLQGEPLGLVSVALTRGEAPVEAVVAEACEQFAPAIERRLGADWRRRLSGGSLPPLSAELAAIVDDPDLPGFSVVVGTRNRPDHAVNCVARVLKQTYPGPVEVIVVDNGASSDATGIAIAAEFGDDERVRYIHDPRPGLSRARNIGLAAARHPVTAFLSDDIMVDALWLAALVRAFRRAPDVRCVVGYCPPMYLDTEAQLVFEKTMAWGWRNGFEARLVGPHLADDRLYPYRIGIGVGANMSFDTAWFQGHGGFDETLGPGTLARGGEDLDAPIRVLLDGGQCVYEPTAIGWHADRYDDRGFGTHMYTYGVGLTAFLASHLADRRTRWQVVRRAPFGARYLLAPEVLPDSIARLDDVPMRFRHAAANMVGRLVGPFFWLRSRRALAAGQAARGG